MTVAPKAPHGPEPPVSEAGASWVVALGVPGRARRELQLAAPDGAVPDTAAADGCEVVFDGVLYDADDLRRELGLEPGEAAGVAELLLRAYLRWQDGLPERLSGRFALAIRDVVKGRVLCIRDPLGVHPFFYADRGEEILVSTSIDALLADERVPAGVNRAAVADHLLHRWPDVGETYFEAVRRVPPGHVMVGDAAGIRSRRYWDPVPPGEAVRWVSDDEVEQFPDLLDRAVERCLDLGTPGIFLSGGLDSVSVAALATDLASERGLPTPQAMSLIFSDPDAYEEPVQRGVAEALGLPHYMLGIEEAVGEHRLLLAAAELSASRPAPLQTMWAPAYLRLAREGAARGVETILTGTGGDEWLTVTPLVARDMLRHLDFAGLARLAQANSRSFQVPRREIWRRLIWKYGAKEMLRTAAGTILRATAPSLLQAYRRRVVSRDTLPWVAPDPALRAELDERGMAAWSERERPDSYYFRELRESLEHPLVAMEYEEIYENGRDAGVRFAAPFIDPELVNFLYRTPLDVLNRGGRAKGLVRDYLDTRFPELGFRRQKKVAATSYARSVRKEQAAGVWRALGGMQSLAELGVLDAARFERFFFEAAAEGHRKDYRIWDALALEAWLRARI